MSELHNDNKTHQKSYILKNKIKTTELVRFDWFIKNLFRDKSDFEVVEGFLSELLKEDITILEILESESNKKRKEDKLNRVDVLVRTEKDENIIIEIQNNDEFDYLQRILFGACKNIVENLNVKEYYYKVKKVISVSIVYFKAAEGEDYIYHGTTSFRGIHTNDELRLTKEQQDAFKKTLPAQLYPEYYLISPFEFNDVIKDTLDEWVYLLKHSEILNSFNAKGIKPAKEKLAYHRLGKRKQKEYDIDIEDMRDTLIWGETQRLKKAYQEKLEKEVVQAKREKAKAQREKAKAEREKAKAEQEKAKAEQEKQHILQNAQKMRFEIARNLLKNGASLLLVATATGLSENEIKNIDF